LASAISPKPIRDIRTELWISFGKERERLKEGLEIISRSTL
jgi:hypothetical protein